MVPEVNSSRSNESASTPSQAFAVQRLSAMRCRYSGLSITSRRSALRPNSRLCSRTRCAVSVTISWQSVCRISAAISAGPRVGLIPTIVAPLNAAPPSQKTKSGTFCNSTPM
ncbi:Uncharacterised protein [Mycobacteroides abscessus subsp. abscessus]|nr:Uncharacterised protein [Mycobacteroides abscessus subsp. abscessus]